MLTVQYSHAAPYIRNRACVAAHQWVNAPTKRATDAAYAEFNAYVASLRILLAAHDYQDTPGIGNERELPEDAINVVRDQLGAGLADQLGFVAGQES